MVGLPLLLLGTRYANSLNMGETGDRFCSLDTHTLISCVCNVDCVCLPLLWRKVIKYFYSIY